MRYLLKVSGQAWAKKLECRMNTCEWLLFVSAGHSLCQGVCNCVVVYRCPHPHRHVRLAEDARRARHVEPCHHVPTTQLANMHPRSNLTHAHSSMMSNKTMRCSYDRTHSKLVSPAATARREALNIVGTTLVARHDQPAKSHALDGTHEVRSRFGLQGRTREADSQPSSYPACYH